MRMKWRQFWCDTSYRGCVALDQCKDYASSHKVYKYTLYPLDLLIGNALVMVADLFW